MKRCLIGVDLGTSATKAGLFTQDGELLAEAQREVPLHTPGPGVVEQDSQDFYTSAAQCVAECIQQSGIDPRRVAGIAFDSQMAGVGSVDEAFQPAARFDSWLDMRCKPFIQHMAQTAGDRVTALTGCPPTCDHGPKMLWLREEDPGAYRRVVKFLMPAGYVAGRMAGLRGEEAFIDATFLHFSGFSDAQAGAWSAELCGMFDLDMNKLPRIVEPWAVIGEVRDQAARDFGLAPGTPIAAGAGDTAANALGAGIVRPGMVFDNAGTASVLAATTGRFVADVHHRALLTMRSVVPGLWHPLAYVAGGGLALRWFRDQFYNIHRGKPLPTEESLYEEMERQAESIRPGAEGLFFSPHLGGRVCPAAPEMRGAWLGFSWNHTQAHFYRAILESVAYEYAYYLSILRELLPGLALTEARAVGGGARGGLWNRIKSAVLGLPYTRLERSEFGAWGSALIAGKAVGVFPDLAETAMRCALPKGLPLKPAAQDTALYAPLVERYIRMQRVLAEYYQEIY